MSEWVEKPLGELATIRVSNVDKKSKAGEQNVRLCNYMDVYAGTYLDDEIEYMEATATGREISNFSLQAGDVIITKDSESPDDIGIPALIDQTAGGLVCGYHLAMLRPDRSKIDPLFLLKQIETDAVRRFYLKRAAGSTRYALATGTIETTPIRLPSLADQKAIASILRSLDTQIEATEGLIAKQERVRAGFMQDLLTRGVDEHGQLRPPFSEAPHLYHQTELGWLPLGWEVMDLANACSVIRDGTHLPPPRTETGPLLLSVRNMVGGGLVLTESDERVPESFFTVMHRNWQIRPGDTLLAIVGATIGKICQVPTGFPKFTLQRSVCVLRGEAGVLEPDLLALLVQRPEFYNALWSRANQTAQPGIYLDQIAKISVPVPLVNEQRFVCLAMKAASGLIDALKADLTKLRFQKSGLMQDLLTGKVSVAPLLEGVA